MKTPSPQPPMKWEKEFIVWFPNDYHWDRDKIKAFIRQAIQSAREEERKRIIRLIEVEFESIGWLPEEGDLFQCFTRRKWNKIKEILSIPPNTHDK